MEWSLEQYTQAEDMVREIRDFTRFSLSESQRNVVRALNLVYAANGVFNVSYVLRPGYFRFRFSHVVVTERLPVVKPAARKRQSVSTVKIPREITAFFA